MLRQKHRKILIQIRSEIIDISQLHQLSMQLFVFVYIYRLLCRMVSVLWQVF